PPLRKARKEKPQRAEDCQPSAAHSDPPQTPADGKEEAEHFVAPVKRERALKTENKKSPKLRTEHRRVIRHRHTHDQRRASRPEIRVFDRERRLLLRLREHRRSPDRPFVAPDPF